MSGSEVVKFLVNKLFHFQCEKKCSTPSKSTPVNCNTFIHRISQPHKSPSISTHLPSLIILANYSIFQFHTTTIPTTTQKACLDYGLANIRVSQRSLCVSAHWCQSLYHMEYYIHKTNQYQVYGWSAVATAVKKRKREDNSVVAESKRDNYLKQTNKVTTT